MDFTYVSQNVLGVGANFIDFETLIPGCQCIDDCSSKNGCSCLPFGNVYDEHGLIILAGDSTIPVTECNSQCSCIIEKCHNRVVQKGIAVQLDVFRTDDKGFGLKTMEKVRLGQFICEYAGEMISLEEAKSRNQKLTGKDPNYVFVLREHTCVDGKEDVVVYCVDPTLKGNLGRFCNHSCDPNLFVVPIRIENLVPHLALFAKRDIVESEELCYSYGVVSDDTVRRFDKPCFCKANNCKGRLPYDESLFE